MVMAHVVRFSGPMTRRLESVLLVSALVAVACTLALTSIAAGITAFVR
jgi:hypothetical protein